MFIGTEAQAKSTSSTQHRKSTKDALPKHISASSQPIHGLPLASAQPVAGDETSVLSDRERNDETHAGDEAQPGVHGTPAPKDF